MIKEIMAKASVAIGVVVDKTVQAFKANKWLRIATPIAAGAILLVTIILSLLGSGNVFTPKKTDEELIRERIDTFLTAYNDGDMEEVLNCLDAKTKNTFNALLNVMGGLAGGLTGFDFDLRDLFSLGVAITDGDFMTLNVGDITVSGSTAVVTTTMSMPGGASTIYFKMTYENDGWYISDMTDTKPASLNESTSQVNPGDIVPTHRKQFVDGVALITYKKDDVYYSGIINTQGKIVYTTSDAYTFTHIGNGATIAFVYNDETYEREAKYIIDNSGKIVFEFDEATQLVAYGDGLALIYKRKETITAVEHLYGVVNSSGNIIQPMINIGTYNNGEHYYAGNGVFAFAVWTGVYHNDYLFWNSSTGKAFSVSGLENPPEFKNGVAFVYDTYYPTVVDPYNIQNPSLNGEGVRASDCFMLYDNGRFENYDMTNKDFKSFFSGYLCYTEDDNENNTYVVDITSKNQNPIIYNQYPADNIHSIHFDGDYGLVSILGANGSLYFTVIDKNGNQKFEPVETKNYFSGKFSEAIIIFQNADDKCCICDIDGNVIVTDYTYITDFSDGIAIACRSEGAVDYNAELIYINKNNQEVLRDVK